MMQWVFCIESILLDQFEKGFPEEYILPVPSSEHLRLGCCSVVGKLELHEGFVAAPRLGNAGVCAIKLFAPAYPSQYFETEVQTFRDLQKAMVMESFIEIYGTFKMGQTSGFLLEYADLGDLETYWSTTPPPLSDAAMHSLWYEMLQLSHAVKYLHNIPFDPAHGNKKALTG